MRLVVSLMLVACGGDGTLPDATTRFVQWRDFGTDDQGLGRLVALGDALYAADTVGNIYTLTVGTDGRATRSAQPRFPNAWMTRHDATLVVVNNTGAVLHSTNGTDFTQVATTHASLGTTRADDALYNVYIVQGAGPAKQVEVSLDRGLTWADVPGARGNGDSVRAFGPGVHAAFVTIINPTLDVTFALSGATSTQLPGPPIGVPVVANDDGLAIRMRHVEDVDPFDWAAGTGLGAREGWQLADERESFAMLHGLLPSTARDLVPLGFDGGGRLVVRAGTSLRISAKPIGANIPDERAAVLRGPGCADFIRFDPRTTGSDRVDVPITNRSGHPIFITRYDQPSSVTATRRTEDATPAPIPDGATMSVQLVEGQTWVATAVDTGECLALYRGRREATTIE